MPVADDAGADASATDPPEACDVLVVGAGPSGATLGAHLAARGLDAVVVDRKRRPTPFSKAGNLWPRTLEMLGGMVRDRAGVDGPITRMRPRSFDLATLDVHSYGAHTATVRGDRYPSPYNAAWLNGQDVIEDALWDTLAGHGRPVAGGWSFVAAREDDDGVEVDLVAWDEEADAAREGHVRTVRCRWLVGCDAGRSQVRAAAGLGFEATPQRGVQLLLLDATLQWARPTAPDRMWMFFHDNGYAGVTPQWGGHHHLWRFERGDEPVRADPGVADFEPLLRELADDPTVRLSDVIWASHIAEPRTGVAPGMRRGRTFLAGDAAHVALPVGGQGMNTGIQDALSLAWRLAAVLEGRAGDVLLDSYEHERLPVRRDLMADQVSSMEAMLDPGLAQRVLLGSLGPALSRIRVAPEFQDKRDAAMLRLSYPDGPAVHDDLGRLAGWRGVRAGERLPDATLSQHGGATASLHDLVHVHDGWTAFVVADGDAVADARAAAVQLAATDDVRVYLVHRRAEPRPSADGVEVLHDLDGHAADALTGDAVVLVRPDGYVGYRGRLASGGALDLLASATGRPRAGATVAPAA